MTPEQRIALTHPCYLSVETMRPIHRRQIGAWSEVLTVNSGHE